MKRRSIIIAFLLVAAFALGIGYAALTDILDIQGTAEVHEDAAEEVFNLDVYFDKDGITVPEGKATASVNPDNNDKASFTITGLADKDSTVSVTYTINNDSELDAVVTPKLLQNSNEEYFEITSDWASTAQTIEAGSSKTITVTVKLLKVPTTTVSASFNIELTAVAG